MQHSNSFGRNKSFSEASAHRGYHHGEIRAVDSELWKNWSVGALAGEVSDGEFLFDLPETFLDVTSPLEQDMLGNLLVFSPKHHHHGSSNSLIDGSPPSSPSTPSVKTPRLWRSPSKMNLLPTAPKMPAAKLGRQQLQQVQQLMSKDAASRSEADIDALISILGSLNFFQQFEREETRTLLKNFECVFFPKKQRIYDQGSVADSFFVIMKGSVKLFGEEGAVTNDPKSLVSIVHVGEGFGEFTADKPLRTTTAVCVTDTHLLSIEKKAYLEILKGARFENAFQRLQWLKAIQDICAKPAENRRKVELNLLLASLKNVKFFVSLPPMLQYSLSRDLGYEIVEKGVNVFTLGDVAEKFYVILNGEVEIILAGGVVIKTLGNNESFGELALINDAPRSATVKTTTATSFLTLSKVAYSQVLKKNFTRGVNRNVDWLSQVFPMFQGASHKTLAPIASSFAIERFLGGEYIVEANSTLKDFFFVISGEVTGYITADFVRMKKAVKEENAENENNNESNNDTVNTKEVIKTIPEEDEGEEKEGKEEIKEENKEDKEKKNNNNIASPSKSTTKTFELFTLKAGGCIGILEDLAVASKWTDHCFSYRVCSMNAEVAIIPIQKFHTKAIPVTLKNDCYTVSVMRSEALSIRWRQILAEEGSKGWQLKASIRLPLVLSSQIGFRADGTFQVDDEEIAMMIKGTESKEEIEHLGKMLLVKARRERRMQRDTAISLAAAKFMGKMKMAVKNKAKNNNNNANDAVATIASIVKSVTKNRDNNATTERTLEPLKLPDIVKKQQIQQQRIQQQQQQQQQLIEQQLQLQQQQQPHPPKYPPPHGVKPFQLLPTLSPRLHESWGTRVGPYTPQWSAASFPAAVLTHTLEIENEDYKDYNKSGEKSPRRVNYMLSSVTGRKVLPLNDLENLTKTRSKTGQQISLTLNSARF